MARLHVVKARARTSGGGPSGKETLPVSDTPGQPVAVSRRICAPAHDIFQILANPVRHLELDGSGMLRGAVSTTMISGVGDVFVMKMYYSELGDYEMNNHVVDYEADRRIGWERDAGIGTPPRPARPRPAGGTGGLISSLLMARTRPS